jgi:hypothetical protein
MFDGLNLYNSAVAYESDASKSDKKRIYPA